MGNSQNCGDTCLSPDFFLYSLRRVRVFVNVCVEQWGTFSDAADRNYWLNLIWAQTVLYNCITYNRVAWDGCNFVVTPIKHLKIWCLISSLLGSSNTWRDVKQSAFTWRSHVNVCLWWPQILSASIWLVRVVLNTQKCVALIWNSFMCTLWNFLIKDNWDFLKRWLRIIFQMANQKRTCMRKKEVGDSWARFQQKALQCPQPKIPDCASEHTHTHTHKICRGWLL